MSTLFSLKDGPRQLLLLALYVLLAKSVVLLFGSNNVVGFLWLASGVSLAMVVLEGNKYLAAAFLGTLLGYLLLGQSVGFALIAALRHTGGLFLGVWLLKREGYFDPALHRLGDFIRLILLAWGVGLFTAFVMLAMGWLDGPTLKGSHSFNQRWTGHTLGIIIVMPLVLVWRRLPREWGATLRLAGEAALIIGLSFLVGQVVFMDWLHDSLGQIARGYWLFLFITWAAVRLGSHGTVLILAVFALQGVMGAQIGNGFFAHDIAQTQLSNYFFYMLSLSVVGMALSTYFTERKHFEAELLRSNRELEQFSYSISHDMRQPLRMISSYMQLLEMKLADQLDGEKREYFNFAIDGAKRLDTMMLGLLEYSRVGRKGEPPAWVQSRALLDEALHFLQPAIAQAQAEVRVLGSWPQVQTCPDEMLRLLQNLVSNALKFRVAGRPPEITVVSDVQADHWRVSVSDNGIGIAPEQVGRLFQVFQRLHSRTAFEGTGIGLALCRKIAEQQGGRIWVESAGEGLGSRFVVELPLIPTQIAAIEAAARAAGVTAGNSPCK